MGTLKLLLNADKYDKDVTATVELNDVRHFYFQKSSNAKTITLELRDLFVSSALKVSATQDSGFSKQFSLETIWDTTNEAATTEIVTFGLQKTDSSYSYNAQFTWPTKETDSISGNVERIPGKLLATLTVFHNDEKRLGLDMTILTQYTSTGVRK